MTNLHLAQALVAAHRSELEAEARASRRRISRRRHADSSTTHSVLASAPDRTSVAAAERVAA